MKTLEKVRVLLIDNDPRTGKLVTSGLKKRGWKIETAPDGETGIKKCLEGVYDVILLDYDPGLDGLNLLERLKSCKQCPPIIMVTDTGNERIAVEALGQDIDDYLIKDSDNIFLEMIIPTIERTLEQKKRGSEKEDLRKKLDESEERYRNLIENLNDVVFTLDQDGIVTYISPSVKRLYSYDQDELLGIHFSKIVHPDDYPAVYESFQNTLEGILEPFEFRIFNANGDEHYVQTASRPSYQDGTVTGTTGVLRDITELKNKHVELEAKTRELGERVKELHCLFEVSNIIDKTNRLEDIYQGIVDIIPLSWQFPEITSARITTKDAVCSSTPFRETKRRQYQDILVQGETYGTIEVFVDGEQLDPDTEPFLKEEDELLSTIRQRLTITIQRMRLDKTLRESEILLAQTQQIASVGSWILDVTENKLTWSNETYRIFGLEPREFAATYEAFLDSVHPEDRTEVDISYSDSLQEEMDTYEIEHRIIRKDTGEVRRVHEKCIHERDTQGVVVRSIGMVQDITDRTERELKYTQILNTTKDGFWVLDKTGKILEANPAAGRMLGYIQEKIVTMTVSDIDAVEVPEETQRHLNRVREEGYALFETKHKQKDGSLLDVEVSISYNPTGDGFYVVFTRDITDRKRAEKERETTLQLLSYLNEQTGLSKLASQIIHVLYEWSECEAVGIRLKEGENYPYFQTKGFSKEHILAENDLYKTDERGEPVRNDLGEPMLECMCGNVIQGRFDPSLPFFTENGSFWVNSTTDFLASTGGEDRQTRIRSRCYGEGYESVALIPLRYGNECIGLLQFNDSHRGRFDEYTISFLEHLASYITLGISERLTADAVRESEKKYRELVELSPGLIAIHEEGIIKFMNEAGMRLIGATSPDQVIGKPVTSFVTPTQRDVASERIKKLLEDHKRSPVYEQKLTCVDGMEKYVEAVVTPMTYDGVQAVLIVAYDITERKQAEKDLMFQSLLLNQIKDVITATDLEGTITYVNEAVCRQLGTTREALIGHHVSDYGESPDLGASQQEIIGKTRRDGEWRGEVVNFRHDGTEIIFETRTQLLRSENGDPIGMIGISTDITEKTYYEDALKRSEEKYRLVVDNAHEAIIITQGGMIKYANPRIVDTLGYTMEEVISSNYLDYIHPDDYTLLEEYDESRERLDGLITTLIIRIFNKEGSIRWVEINSAFIEWEGNRASLDFINDITDRKNAENALQESEQKYRGLFDSSMDVVFVSTLDGRFVDINRAGEEFFGYTRDELLKLDIRDVYYNPMERLRYMNIMAVKGYVKDYEVVFKRKDGTQVESFLTATIRRDEDGEILGYQGIIKDVTELKRTQEQLIRAQKMEAIGTLAAGIAHDFNNILATIMGYSSFLKGKVSDNREVFDGFNAIEKASIRASNMTSQLLAYTRKSMRDVTVIDINSLAAEVVDFISRTFDKSISIEFRKGKNLPMIEGDESQLYQVIMNCAVNAQHAMPNGGRLEIETFFEETTEVIEKPHFTIETGRYVTIQISDTGVGMGKDTLSRIFEPYFTTRGNQGGSGLGMSVVFGIVKSHRGYIDVKSEPGRGTVVNVSFPVSDEKKADTMDRIDAVEGGTENILVIDDEQQILHMAQALLEGSGYNVQIASSGKEGLKIVRNMRPDLIILDLKMPGMDGRRVLQELMTIDRDLKVLISTGFIDTGQKDALIEMGARGLIEKPFTADDMKREIRKILEE